MASDLTVRVRDEPGELARLGHTLGAGGANIDGICAMTVGGGECEIHVLVDDATIAFGALQSEGIAVESEAEVLVIDVEDRPGVLGEITEMLGEAGINITLVYLATGTRLVLAADDLAGAKAALC
ncbi:MAG: ACT domain-containing protein [Acidimicrobiia bacterium]|nr:ACT domain-containing protein [Acidimicrobiia bacterium]